MGYYINPSSKKFRKDINSQIFIDKTELIAKINRVINTQQRYLCISRPRRFGKTMATSMLSAYYEYGEDADELFHGFKITEHPSYNEYKNKFDVIMINMQEFLSQSSSIESMIHMLQEDIIMDFLNEYSNIAYRDNKNFIKVMKDVYFSTEREFVILIDEWDCIFREYKSDVESQKKYLDFLRLWLKDQDYVGLAYMTGILPIKKYGTHSALNMFYEYSMTTPAEFVSYFGFTEEEVCALCKQYNMSIEEVYREISNCN